jgi:hypothetical protein
MALTDDCVAFWKLDNENDLVGSANFTNNNSVNFGIGLIGNCADNFNTGSSRSLTVANSLGITNGSYSFSVWIYLISLPASGDNWAIFSNSNNTNDIDNQITIRNNGGIYQIRFARNRYNISSQSFLVTFSPSIDTWYHIVQTYDGTNLKGYIDGTYQSQLATSGNGSGTTTTRTALGTGLSGTFYTGKIDCVGVWTRDITSSEVTELYNGGAGIEYPFTPPPSTGQDVQFFGAGI